MALIIHFVGNKVKFRLLWERRGGEGRPPRFVECRQIALKAVQNCSQKALKSSQKALKNRRTLKKARKKLSKAGSGRSDHYKWSIRFKSWRGREVSRAVTLFRTFLALRRLPRRSRPPGRRPLLQWCCYGGRGRCRAQRAVVSCWPAETTKCGRGPMLAQLLGARALSSRRLGAPDRRPRSVEWR